MIADVQRTSATWNSHITSLAHLAGAVQAKGGVEVRRIHAAEVAGLTGAAFRMALCERCTPPSLYLTWSHPHYFAQWLAALGIDAAVLWHPAGAAGAGCWLKRVRELARQSVALGYPVMYWDNLAFSVITGVQGERFVSAGIQREVVHPALADPLTGAPYLPRLAGDDNPGPFELGLTSDELTGQINGDMFFACPLGAIEVDSESALVSSIESISRELAGSIEYPRSLTAAGFSGETQYGLAALGRLIEELKDAQVHHFGLVQFIQSQAEARRWGVEYLKCAAGQLPADIAPRLSQAAVFFERSRQRWQELARRFSLPLDADSQMTRESQRGCADELYQIHKTEETARRLISGLIAEYKRDSL
jgi:hypothetical protein